MPETPTDPVAAWIADTRTGTRGIEWPEDVERLLAALDRVLALHREFRVYDECGHHHTDEDVAEGRAIDGGDFASCEDGYVFSICRECCARGSAAPAGSYGSPFQTEECASDHDHSDCWPCGTVTLISGELLGEVIPVEEDG